MPIYSFFMVAAAGIAGLVLVLKISFDEMLTSQDMIAEISASWSAFVARISSSLS